MKVEHRGGMKNTSNTAGIVNIEDFEGASMRVSTELLKQALTTIENFGKNLDNEYINIGISKFDPKDEVGMFFIFLDGKKTLAYAVAGAYEE